MTRHAQMLAEREECFRVLVDLGPGASLHRLAEILRAQGRPRALSTLKSYSTEGRWQERLAELRAASAAAHRERVVERAADQVKRESQFGQALEGLSRRGIAAKVSDPQSLQGESLASLARIGKLGLDIRREALAEQRDRTTLTLDLTNRLVRELVPAIHERNAHPDRDVRMAAFAEAIDALVDRFLAEVELEDPR